MSVPASNLIAQVLQVLQDESGVTYSETQALDWLNDAQRAVTDVRPDAKSAIVAFQLVPGTKQDVPTGYRRLMGIIRNMGADGATPGKAIRGPVPQEDLDSYDPDWHTAAADTVVTEYVYDETVRKTFYVTPPVHATTAVYVEAKLAAFPADVAAVEDNIDLDEDFHRAMREWMLYCFLARDSERTPNWQRGARHFANFFQILGVKLQASMAVSPKILEYAR